MTHCQPFVCMECEEPRTLYKGGICKDCWLSWQEHMDHLAGADGEETP